MENKSLQIIPKTETGIIISRSCYCPHCYANNRPRKGDWFTVVGGTSGKYMYKKSHQDGYRGFTPHVIEITQPVNICEDLITVKATCGVCQIKHTIEKGQPVFTIFASRPMTLKHEDFKALLLKWTRTGFEII